MKKGFTLIELLAVIVILGIIAAIIIPSVSKTINNSKKSSAEKSAEGFIRAVELAELNYQLETEGMISQSIEDLSLTDSEKKDVVVNSIVISESGEVTSATLSINGYKCTYEKNKTNCGLIKPAVAKVDSTTHIINNTWEELKNLSEQIAADNSITSTSTTAHGLTVGDKITIDGLTCYIAGFNHDVDNGETGITLVANSGVSREMNSTNTNKGGWKDSELRAYMQSAAFTDEIPTIATSAKSVAKMSDTGDGGAASLFTPTADEDKDKLWLLSFEEVGLTSAQSTYFVSVQGTMYPLFKESETEEALKCRTDISVSLWRLRSSITAYDGGFWSVTGFGYGGSSDAYETCVVVFGFCI